MRLQDTPDKILCSSSFLMEKMKDFLKMATPVKSLWNPFDWRTVFWRCLDVPWNQRPPCESVNWLFSMQQYLAASTGWTHKLCHFHPLPSLVPLSNTVLKVLCFISVHIWGEKYQSGAEMADRYVRCLLHQCEDLRWLPRINVRNILIIPALVLSNSGHNLCPKLGSVTHFQQVTPRWLYPFAQVVWNHHEKNYISKKVLKMSPAAEKSPRIWFLT